MQEHKQVILIYLGLIIFISFLFYIRPSVTGYITAGDLSVELEMKEKYGPNQIINGELKLTFGELETNTYVKSYLNGKEVNVPGKKLSWLLDNANIDYDVIEEEYTITSGAKDSTISSLVALRLKNDIQEASMNLSGTSEYVKIDIGNDEEIDWQYYDKNIPSFSNNYYPNEADANTQIGIDREVIGSFSDKCENIEVDFDGLFENSVININAKVEKLRDGGNLKARVEGYNSCDMPEPGSSLTDVRCNVTIENPIDGSYQICLYNEGGSEDIYYYQVPIVDLEEPYYFITIKKILFSNVLNGVAQFKGSRFKDSLNEYLAGCNYGDDGFCNVPLKVSSSSNINLFNLRIIDNNGRVYRSFYEVNYKAPRAKLYNTTIIPLELLNVSSPDKFGEGYRFKVAVKNKYDESRFDVAEVPIARISVKSTEVSLGEDVVFDGSQSSSVEDREIAEYKWDIDGKKIEDVRSSTKYTFNSRGEHKVKLVVVDSEGIESSPAVLIIIVVSEEKSIDLMIEQTRKAVNNSLVWFNLADTNTKDTVRLLGYKEILTKANSDLTSFSLRLSTIKESTATEEQKELQYKQLLNEIRMLQNKLPVDIRIDEMTFANYVDYNDVPDPSSLASNVELKEPYKIAIYNAQAGFSVSSTGRRVSVRYIGGDEESFRLVKKTVLSGSPNAIVEKIPFSVKSLLTTGTNVGMGLVKFDGSIKEIAYTLEDGNLADLRKTKTIAIPDLSQVGSGIPKVSCGDGICHYSEAFDIDEKDENKAEYCPEDCKSKINWTTLIILFIILVGGVYYINFYKGPWNFRDLANKISVGLFKKRLFTNQKDLLNLVNFVKSSLARGFKEEQLRQLLMKKGWKKEQIDYAFKQVKR